MVPFIMKSFNIVDTLEQSQGMKRKYVCSLPSAYSVPTARPIAQMREPGPRNGPFCLRPHSLKLQMQDSR